MGVLVPQRPAHFRAQLERATGRDLEYATNLALVRFVAHLLRKGSPLDPAMPRRQKLQDACVWRLHPGGAVDTQHCGRLGLGMGRAPCATPPAPLRPCHLGARTLGPRTIGAGTGMGRAACAGPPMSDRPCHVCQRGRRPPSRDYRRRLWRRAPLPGTAQARIGRAMRVA